MKVVSWRRKLGVVYGAVGFLKKLVLVVAGLMRKGLSWGIVLFVALFTLSFLNSGLDWLLDVKDRQVVIRSQITSGSTGANSSVSYYVPRSFVSSGAGNQGISSSRGLAAQDTVRESRYWLGSLDEVMRTVSRFSRN